MAAHRIAAIASRCRPCSASPALLASFKPAPHLPARTAALAAVVRRQNFHRSALVRTSEKPESDAAEHETAANPMEAEEELNYEEASALEAIETSEDGPEEFVGETDPEPLADNYKPWYLQVEPPKISRSPLREKDPLPKIPEDSPEELAPLLKELDEEQGISAMKILDLRHLDRPAAIGSNTIMIIGTARSVRHLHGTADRICRWLRSQYKWRPHADGLLGRNELKLINRRKRRRGKVVSGEMGVLDEADSAGWVCVNTPDKGIVVQLFTETKREEIDLEGLWSDVLEKDRQRKERLANKLKEDSLIRRVNTGPRLDEEPLRQHIPPVSGPFTQTRSFHSGRRQFSLAQEPIMRPSDARLQANIKRPLVTDRAKSHIRKLKSNPEPEKLLGDGPDDRASTPFLQTFYDAIDELPRPAQIQYTLQLLTLGSFIKPEAYSIQAAQRYLRTLRSQGAAIRIDFYYYILLQISLLPRTYATSADQRLENILSIMLDMHNDFEASEMEAFEKSPEVRYACWLALAPAGLLTLRRDIMRTQFIDNDQQWVSPLQNDNARRVREQFGPLDPRMVTAYDCIPDATAVRFGIIEHHLDSLCAMAWCGNWKRFWDIWDNLQLAMIPRSQEYYQVALGAILLGRNQLAALRAVRLFPDYMANESTPVGIGGDLAGYMLGVIEVAKGGKKTTEFEKLEIHCMQRRRREVLIPK